ncbi:MAG TPA: SCO family protein [Thermomicrobiales bacterium]|nr:SCO family protein [Thermomicrobiales bacterium]
MATTQRSHYPTGADLLESIKANRRMAMIFVLGFTLLILAAVLAQHFANTTAGSEPAFTGLAVEPPRELPPLELQRADGGIWSSAELNGRLAMFFFGYTNCPDVCPLTLSRAKQAIAQLGDDAARVDFYFVTVDPERDTPRRLGMYVGQFDPTITALTGTPAQLEAAMAAFGVVAQQVPTGSEAGYAVDHTATSFLIDDGAIRLLYGHDTPAADLAADLRAILAERPRA